MAFKCRTLKVKDLLHAANLQHGTDGFTSPLKEGVLRIFSPLKIGQLRPGLNPQTWVLKASTLPLDHRSCWLNIHNNNNNKELNEQTLHALNTIMKQNYFQYGGQIFQPQKGIAMESPISGTMAEIYLTVFRSDIYKTLARQQRNSTL
jgi:hypothetical protein